MVEITWLGHGTYQFRLATGEVILVDPWIDGNPIYPAKFSIDRVDVMLITHGHLEIARLCRPDIARPRAR